MSGHSKWSTIKRQKGSTDAKRGQLFTRLGKDITVAARQGGGDINANATLRAAVEKARAANMPKDNIQRAIDRGTGNLPGQQLVEAIYEGYGPGGVALLIKSLTDNKNRTVAEIRSTFNKNGGSLADAGSVSYIFTGTEPSYTIPLTGETEESFANLLEALEDLDDVVEVFHNAENTQ
jgi:YebC/PmpR family DNA-binding regulatory protein